MKTNLLVLLFFILLPAAAAANSGSIKLLAMSELDGGAYRGSIAYLTLEVNPGSGRVFVNTFPISKIDTQISMRFAKQIACKYSEADCSRHDFIYTLKASSGIVGGPSAGAAASVLTVSLLKNIPLKEGIAITGTINSGGLIGPVGGLKAKIEAASNAQITKVLIPEASLNEENQTIDFVDYGDEIGVEVIEVSTLGGALYYFTGQRFEKPEKELVVDTEYKRIMKSLAVMLCNRSSDLQNEYLLANLSNSINESILELERAASNETDKAKAALESGDYYTAASYCFRANIDYRYLAYYFQNFSADAARNKAKEIMEEIDDFEEETDSIEIRTLTDLQAYMITKERIFEARDKLSSALEDINNTDSTAYWLAFAKERLSSAASWSYFFGAEGQMFKLDNESLRQSCEIKISEAEERYQYVNFYFPDTISSTRKEINRANIDMEDGNYIMCLYRASRAKSQANVILSVIGVKKSMLDKILSQKLYAAEQVIVDQQEIGIFPIMGYSYFEYANSLSEDDPSSAIIYAEYALELSNFDFYFEKKGLFDIPALDYKLILLFVLGVIIGVSIGIKAGRMKKQRKQNAKQLSNVIIKRANASKRKKKR